MQYPITYSYTIYSLDDSCNKMHVGKINCHSTFARSFSKRPFCNTYLAQREFGNVRRFNLGTKLISECAVSCDVRVEFIDFYFKMWVYAIKSCATFDICDPLLPCPPLPQINVFVRFVRAREETGNLNR